MKTAQHFKQSQCGLRLLLLVGCSLAALKLSAAPFNNPPVPTQRAAAHLAQLPLYFEANAGQTDKRVLFLARGAGYSLFFTPQETVLALVAPQPSQTVPMSRPSKLSVSAKRANPKTAVLRMRLQGANPQPHLRGEQPLGGHSNYFMGSNPKQWHTGLTQYGRVRYEQVYRGIDLIYYGNQRQLEYDFVVAPGVQPQQIKLRWQGAQGVRLNQRGELLLKTVAGTVTQHAPIIYQEVAGVRQRIAGGYVVRRTRTGMAEVSFRVSAYDKRRPLIIDPTLAYSTYLGGDSLDLSYSIATDSAHNIYVAGYTDSSDFPTPERLSPSIENFVVKLKADGSGLIYSTFLGVSGDPENPSPHFFDQISIAVDAAGNAYVAGNTDADDFPVHNALQATRHGDSDVFIAKINPTGSTLLYATYLGGAADDVSNSIAIDPTGNVYVTGFTESTDFPTLQPIRATLTNKNPAGSNAFVVKLNAAGSALIYSTYLGGSGDRIGKSDSGNGIAADSQGNAYITGVTASSDFPTYHALQASSPDSSTASTAFVTKLNPAGAFIYSTFLGGSQGDGGASIATDSVGNAYITGSTFSADFPICNAFQPTLKGVNNAFVTKLNAAGSALLYSTYLGGNYNDSGVAIAVDSAGDAYVAGDAESTDFPLLHPLQSFVGQGLDTFITELNPTGNALLYSTCFGGLGNISDAGAASIALDSANNIYVTGSVTGTFHKQGLLITPDALQANNSPTPITGSDTDAFILKLSNQPDSLAPTLNITVPANGSFFNRFPAPRGTAVERPFNNGLNQVQVEIRRVRDGAYWTGSGWSPTPTLLSTNLTLPNGPLTTVPGNNWHLTNVPIGSDLSNGGYRVIAFARDQAGNQSSATTTVNIDQNAPMVSITAPANGATISRLPYIAGQVTDTGGSGVASVQLLLRRVSDGRYYSGSGWVTNATPLASTVSGQTWVRRSGLPSGAALTAGGYRLTATAFDRAGNRSSVTSSFEVRASGLSAALVQVKSQRVALNFVGALDAAGAEDVSHYSVTVNGRNVGVEAATYNASSHAVSLLLAPGSLQSGDKVIIAWSGLATADGSVLGGQTDLLSAG